MPSDFVILRVVVQAEPWSDRFVYELMLSTGVRHARFAVTKVWHGRQWRHYRAVFAVTFPRRFDMDVCLSIPSRKRVLHAHALLRLQPMSHSTLLSCSSKGCERPR